MPLKKKKYNARFPPARIKKIMQTDEEVGKVAAPVPIMISRALELFAESLLSKTLRITNARHAKTLSPSHMRQCIMSESRFDFLRELVKNVPDISINDDGSMENSLSPNPHSDPNTSSAAAVSNFDSFFSSHPSKIQAAPSTIVSANGSSSSSSTIDTVLQRPLSVDSVKHTDEKRVKLPLFYTDISSTTAESDLLRKKLTEMSRKSSSLEAPSGRLQTGVKLSRYDSSPAAFTNSLERNNSIQISVPSSPTVTSPFTSTTSKKSAKQQPPLKVKTDEVQANNLTPIVKIDYSRLLQQDKNNLTPIINIDLSHLNPASSNGNKSLLSNLPDNGFSTPTLTTPTRLNHIQFSTTSQGPTSQTPTAPTASSSTAGSTLEMDEDYDNI